MASRVYGYQGYKDYQYDTTPRKVQPEYKPDEEQSRIKSKKNEGVKKTSTNKKTQTKSNKVIRADVKKKATFVAYIVFGFSILFTIGYRDSIINEKFNKKESLKAEFAEIQKTNEQLEVSLENELNLTSVEGVAKDELGMAKLSNDQKIYVNLPKREYVESRVEGIYTEQSENMYQRFWNSVKSIFE